MGHARRVAGRAGVAASVDGEGLPDLQGTCGWQRGPWRGTRGLRTDVPSDGWQGSYIPPHPGVSLLLATRPASLPVCKQHRKTRVPGLPTLPVWSIAVGKSLPL